MCEIMAVRIAICKFEFIYVVLVFLKIQFLSQLISLKAFMGVAI